MIKKFINKISKDFNRLLILREQKWLGFFLFNIIMMLLLLLYTAGYFNPYFPLTVNFIVLVGIILSVILLNVQSKTIFLLALLFWVFAAFLKVLHIDVWAERTAVYTFESMVVGLVVFIIENRSNNT